MKATQLDMFERLEEEKETGFQLPDDMPIGDKFIEDGITYTLYAFGALDGVIYLVSGEYEENFYHLYNNVLTPMNSVQEYYDGSKELWIKRKYDFRTDRWKVLSKTRQRRP